MFVYYMMGKMACILLSFQVATILSFNEPIDIFVYGKGQNNEYINMQISSDNKVLVLKPLKKDIESNLYVKTKKNEYNFKIKFSKDKPHKFLKINKASKDKKYILKKDNKKIAIFEGEQSTWIHNNSNKDVKINETIIQKKEKAYFGKGFPLYISKRRIWN
jgi:hypothetical protein